MARGLNKAMIIGNLGRDPEVKYLPSGQAVANFSVATSEQYKDRDGNQQERTEWHRVVFFGKLAEIAGQYLGKGKQVYIEGRIQTRQWEGQDGQKRYTTEIVGNTMLMLGGRGGDFSGGEQSEEGPSYDQGQQGPEEDIPF